MTTRQHLAYDDSATLSDLRDECRGVNLERLARLAVEQPLPLHYDRRPRETPKSEIAISEATAALAAAIYGTD